MNLVLLDSKLYTFSIATLQINKFVNIEMKEEREKRQKYKKINLNSPWREIKTLSSVKHKLLYVCLIKSFPAENDTVVSLKNI